MGTYILGYRHWKSKAVIKRALKNQLKSNDNVKRLNPEDPAIDFIEPRTGLWGTPEEIRKHTGKNEFVFTNTQRSFFGTMKYNTNSRKWNVT